MLLLRPLLITLLAVSPKEHAQPGHLVPPSCEGPLVDSSTLSWSQLDTAWALEEPGPVFAHRRLHAWCSKRAHDAAAHFFEQRNRANPPRRWPRPRWFFCCFVSLSRPPGNCSSDPLPSQICSNSWAICVKLFRLSQIAIIERPSEQSKTGAGEWGASGAGSSARAQSVLGWIWKLKALVRYSGNSSLNTRHHLRRWQGFA
jgi:hypothetical protein